MVRGAVVLGLLAAAGAFAGESVDDRIKQHLAELHGKDPDAQEGALEELRQIGRPAVAPLIAELGSETASVRRESADALGYLGPLAEPAVPALTRQLADRDVSARASAADALGAIGPASASALPRLVALLADPEWRVRTAAARAIGGLGPKASTGVAALTPLLSDSDGAVRAAAIASLRRLAPVSVEAAAAVRRFDDAAAAARPPPEPERPVALITYYLEPLDGAVAQRVRTALEQQLTSEGFHAVDASVVQRSFDERKVMGAPPAPAPAHLEPSLTAEWNAAQQFCAKHFVDAQGGTSSATNECDRLAREALFVRQCRAMGAVRVVQVLGRPGSLALRSWSPSGRQSVVAEVTAAAEALPAEAARALAQLSKGEGRVVELATATPGEQQAAFRSPFSKSTRAPDLAPVDTSYCTRPLPPRLVLSPDDVLTRAISARWQKSVRGRKLTAKPSSCTLGYFPLGGELVMQLTCGGARSLAYEPAPTEESAGKTLERASERLVSDLAGTLCQG